MKLTFEKLKNLDFVSNEAYKTLRTNITFCGEDVRVIAVTSSTPNEGKTNVTFNLARAFAEDNKRILFVDADIRKSVLEARLGADQEVKGLSHYLTGKAELKDIVYGTNVDHLDFIGTGPVAPNPSELLGNQKFQRLLEWARSEYQYVMIDCPPIGSVIDAAVVARQCDGAVYVIESEATSWRLAQRGKEQLEKTGCKILGAVLNKVEMSGKRYGYGKYYGKYYGRYYGKK